VVLRYGLRCRCLQPGNGHVYVYNREYEETGMKTYRDGDYFNRQNGRTQVRISYLINDTRRKSGLCQTRQYYQIATLDLGTHA
jgi:hypothetical protein